MERDKAFNIAIGCVMASAFQSSKEKKEIIDALRLAEEQLIEDQEWYDESETLPCGCCSCCGCSCNEDD